MTMMLRGSPSDIEHSPDSAFGADIAPEAAEMGNGTDASSIKGGRVGTTMGSLNSSRTDLKIGSQP